MNSIYKDAIKDALYPKKKGTITKRNKYIKIESVRSFSAADVKRLRSFLQLSVSLFASLMNVSVKTVEAWERGDNPVTGPSLRLMNMIKRNPDILLDSGVVDDLTSLM